MKEYLDDVLLNLRPQLLERHVSVRLACPDNFSVEAEPDVIYRIVSNLVVNATQHAFAHMATGAIRIDVVPRADQVLIRFADNGCGIPGDHLSRIYEPIFTTARNSGSLGLGLHVVYNLVTRSLGGRLQCMSGAGEGTIFDIEFPIEKDTNADDKPSITAGA
ncbi:MAG: HAMP domain-containing sensor histidine kinase [Candidatus Krumholzibacteria bacterium]|jgi:signal transduction histidine kinase|nr:HAMP domain-containing sensor histidine kinase [Candidatus Krumholzibacteria bacterium]